MQQLLIEMHACPCNFAISVFNILLSTWEQGYIGTRLINNTGIVQCCRSIIIEPIAGLKVLFLD